MCLPQLPKLANPVRGREDCYWMPVQRFEELGPDTNLVKFETRGGQIESVVIPVTGRTAGAVRFDRNRGVVLVMVRIISVQPPPLWSWVTIQIDGAGGRRTHEVAPWWVEPRFRAMCTFFNCWLPVQTTFPESVGPSTEPPDRLEWGSAGNIGAQQAYFYKNGIGTLFIAAKDRHRRVHTLEVQVGTLRWTTNPMQAWLPTYATLPPGKDSVIATYTSPEGEGFNAEFDRWVDFFGCGAPPTTYNTELELLPQSDMGECAGLPPANPSRKPDCYIARGWRTPGVVFALMEPLFEGLTQARQSFQVAVEAQRDIDAKVELPYTEMDLRPAYMGPPVARVLPTEQQDVSRGLVYGRDAALYALEQGREIRCTSPGSSWLKLSTKTRRLMCVTGKNQRGRPITKPVLSPPAELFDSSSKWHIRPDLDEQPLGDKTSTK